ncbi:MAG: DUF177 domain-containing protein [Chloroflexota bacterium]
MSAGDPHPSHPVDAHGDPLTFNVAGLLAEPAGAVREYRVDSVDVDPGEGLEVLRPVSGGIRLMRTNRGLIVETDLTTALGGECARCLRPAPTEVRVQLEEEVLPSIDLASGAPVELEEGEDPETARLTDHHELELRPLVLEGISLQEPIAPLCEPDCPGLCEECGERLSPGHTHGDGPIDPRLEALRAFRPADEDEGEGED